MAHSRPASALTRHGSTRTWRRLRTEANTRLTLDGPQPCPRCGQPVHPDHNRHLNPDQRPFDLGHETDRQHGGTDTHTRPEHATCNRSAGATAPKTQTRPW